MAIVERLGCIVALVLLAVGPQIAAQAPDDEQGDATESAAEVGEAGQQARVAFDLPIEKRSQIAHQQYGTTSFDDQDGDNIRLITEFTNGRRDQGGFFCAELAIIGADDRLLMRVRQRTGVGVSTSWKPMRKRVEDKFKIDHLQGQQIETVEIVHYACGSVGRPRLRISSQALVGDIINDHGGDVATPPETRTPRERLGLF